MKKTGAEIFVASLAKEKVDIIFGYPGGAVLPIYDELYNQPLKHILVRHEQGAVHMADGYAKASGKPGVCLVTSGPGATNAVTGLATAYMDSIPIVVFSGQVPTNLIGNDAFQEADIVGITRPCTKHNYLVKDVKDLARIIKEAFYVATTGRPGPVLVDIPKDVMIDSCEFNYPAKAVIPSYQPKYEGHSRQIKKAIDMIMSSKRPVVYAGGGVLLSKAEAELKKFVDKLDIPITLTLMGLGAYPGTNKNFLGMLGMHGTYRANMAMSHTDCLIAIGSRFDDRVTGKLEEFAPYAKIIHVDIDPTSISKNVEVDVPIVGDAKSVLKELIKAIPGASAVTKFKKGHKDWHKQIADWESAHKLAYDQDMNGKIKPQFVIEKIYDVTKGNAVVATDVGQHQMWTAQFYKFNKPGTFLTSGGLGTMGYGLPAGIGAHFAQPKKDVMVISGDGSIQMNTQELATAVQYKVPVKVAIINNGYLGMVRQWQEFFFEEHYSHSYMEAMPDFVKLVEAYGGVGFKTDDPKEVEKILKESLKIKDKPVVMDFIVEPKEGVYPMVATGKALSDMVLL